MKQLTSSLTRHDFWHWRERGERTGHACEARQAWLLEEGGLLQETVPPPILTRPVARAFEQERRRWRTYLVRRPLDHFGLERSELQIILPGPPRLWLREPPTWSLALGLTTPALGRRLIARRYRCPLPPSMELRAHLDDLCRIRRLEQRPFGETPILIPGELLLDALSHAIEQVVNRTGELGRWVDLSPPLPGSLRGLVDRHQRFRFLPAAIAQVPTEAWRAAVYDADERALICVRHGEATARRYLLGEPLYRLVGRLRFCGQVQSLSLKETTYILPSALLG